MYGLLVSFPAKQTQYVNVSVVGEVGTIRLRAMLAPLELRRGWHLNVKSASPPGGGGMP